MRKFRVKQIDEYNYLPQTKTKYQLFWRTIWFFDCESTSLIFRWCVGGLARATLVIQEFKKIQEIKKTEKAIKTKYPKIHKL